jgi:hypothetical protein
MFEQANGSKEIRDHRITTPPFSDFGAFVADHEAGFAQEQFEDRESQPVAWELETPFLAAARGSAAGNATGTRGVHRDDRGLRDPSFRRPEQLVGTLDPKAKSARAGPRKPRRQRPTTPGGSFPPSRLSGACHA